MSKILSRSLRALATVYGLPGQQNAPQEFDVTAPIQPVFDVSALSYRDQGVLVEVETSTATAGGSVPVRAAITKSSLIPVILAEMQAARINRDQSDLYLLAHSHQATAATSARLSSLTLSVEPPIYDVPDGARTFLIGFGNNVLATPVTINDERPIIYRDTSGTERPVHSFCEYDLTQRISSVNFVTVDDGGGGVAVLHKFRFALMPRFVPPFR